MEFLQAVLYIGMLLLVTVFHKRGTVKFVYLVAKIQGPSVWELVTMHAKKFKASSQLLRTHICELCEFYSYEPWGFWTMTGDFVVVLSNVECVSELYRSKNLCKKPNFIYADVADYLGEGSFAIRDVEKWKKHRKVNNPVFRKEFLESNIDILIEGAANIIKEFQKQGDGPAFDIAPIIETQTVYTTMSFLSSNKVVFPDLSRVLPMLSACTRLLHAKSVNPIRHWFRLRFHKATKELDKAIRSFIADGKAAINKLIEETTSELLARDNDEPRNLMECGLKNVSKTGEFYSREEMLDEIVMIFTAGFDTTKTVTKIAILLLALHPEVQEKVFDELDSIFGSNDKPPTSQDLDKMEYLGMVIKETLRMFPPGAMIVREATEETNIKGTIIPKGACVMVNIMALHRNPDNFQDPLKFIPERFLPEILESRHPHAYIPFSSGIRNCIGQLQAIMAMKTTLSSIIRRYKVLPGEGLNSIQDIKLSISVTLDVKNAVVKLVSRK